jgi:flagellar biosynthesis protein FliQ
MTEELALYLGRRAMEVGLLLMAPVLVVTLVIGFLAALLQAVSSIRDMTLGMILKLVCIGVTLIVSGSWMAQTAVGFTRDVFNLMQSMSK